MKRPNDSVASIVCCCMSDPLRQALRPIFYRICFASLARSPVAESTKGVKVACSMVIRGNATYERAFSPAYNYTREHEHAHLISCIRLLGLFRATDASRDNEKYFLWHYHVSVSRSAPNTAYQVQRTKYSVYIHDLGRLVNTVIRLLLGYTTSSRTVSRYKRKLVSSNSIASRPSG